MALFNEIAAYTVLGIWVVGALVLGLGLGALASHLAWYLLKEIKGWTTVYKALKLYNQQNRGEN